MRGSIAKRGNTYTYIVDIGKDLATGKRRQKTKGGFSKKKDAQIAMIKIITEINENTFIEQSPENFSDFITDWMVNHYKRRVKETTFSSRKYLIEKHLLKDNLFSKVPLSSITTKHIDNFYNIKLEAGYSRSTVRKLHQLLNLALTQAVKWNKIKFNPVLNTDPPSEAKKEIQIWSFEEIRQFLKKCSEERLYIAFLLAIYTGMRKGEILGLKWSDINFTKKTIKTERTLSHIPKLGYILTSVKTKNSNRQIPISDNIIIELKKLKDSQITLKKRLGSLYQDSNLIICTETGTFQDPKNLMRVMKRAIKNSGVSTIRFHDLRHTHASILLSEGVDIVKVSSRLGHSNPKVTLEFYAHLVPNIDDDVAEIFHSAIGNF
ncbi:tyrosine-type recombinase/integrase [Bacillus sp. DJP31]|uniref:site-specific integrase n=1 Tax=Bacillus sp. DJP31 TaxID=3409789 RepID=UPI003BB4EDC0